MATKLRIVIYEEGKEPQTMISDLTPGHQIMVGRGDDVQLWLTDRSISRNHCRMVYDNVTNCLFVEDLKSRNGTYVNGQKIDRKILKDGDEIRLATTSYFTVSFGKSSTKPPITNSVTTPVNAPPLGKTSPSTLQIPPNVHVPYSNTGPRIVSGPISNSAIQTKVSQPPGVALTTPINLIGAEFGGYKIEQQIGKGDMAIVYRGMHMALRRLVAIKTLIPRLLPDEIALKRFNNVAKIAGQLGHPNIVGIYDSGDYTYQKSDITINIPYLVMEYVQGSTLEGILKVKKILPMATSLKIVGYIASALIYLNKRNIIHRDINPSNVLIGPEEVPKLIGLGLSKSFDEEFAKALTNPGKGLGMTVYTAPEQWLDASKTDHRADIYSLGALFYRCVCGQNQYNTTNDHDCIRYIANNVAPIPPYELNKEITRSISDIILKAISYDPNERFKDAEEFLEEMKPYITPRVREGFEKARKNFFAMFPSSQSIPGFEFESLYRPAEEVGGDFYDFFQLNEQEFGVVIGDITGHGVEAAVVVGMVKIALKTIAKQSKSTSEAFFRLNQEVYPDLETTTYATINYGIINRQSKTIRLSRAGHTPLIIYNPERNPQLEVIEPDGVVVGMFSECSCKEVTIQLQKGDCLIQYTDGVTEAMNRNQEEFGIQRLQEVILQAGEGGKIKTILTAIEAAVMAFTGAEAQQDDIAITCIKIT